MHWKQCSLFLPTQLVLQELIWQLAHAAFHCSFYFINESATIISYKEEINKMSWDFESNFLTQDKRRSASIWDIQPCLIWSSYLVEAWWVASLSGKWWQRLKTIALASHQSGMEKKMYEVQLRLLAFYGQYIFNDKTSKFWEVCVLTLLHFSMSVSCTGSN